MRMALQPTKFPQMRMEPLELTIKLFFSVFVELYAQCPLYPLYGCIFRFKRNWDFVIVSATDDVATSRFAEKNSK